MSVLSFKVKKSNRRLENLESSTETIEESSINFDYPTVIKDEIPYGIQQSYTDDLNIISIHNIIRKRFGCLLGNIKMFNKEIKKMTKELDKQNSYVEKDNLICKINMLRNEIDELISGRKWEQYLDSAKCLLLEYEPLQTNESKGIVEFSLKKQKIVDENLELRLMIIDEYLNVAKNYIQLDIQKINNQISKCPNCDKSHNDINIITDTGLYHCECGCIIENLNRDSTFKDYGRVNTNSKLYNNQSTFYKVFDRYAGVTDEKDLNLISQKLDDYFRLKNLPTGEFIRSLPLNDEGKKDDTNIQLLLAALCDCKLTKYYNIVHPIAYTYWGWKPPSISHLRDIIFEAYHKTQQIYDTYKTRNSCLNANIRLYLLLRAHDYPCTLEDFKIVKSRDSLVYHQQMWKIMCEHTGIKYVPLL